MLRSQTPIHSAPLPPSHDFISVALEVARSLEEDVMGILLFLKKYTKGIAPFCAVLEEEPTCCGTCGGSGHHTWRL